MTPIRVVCVCVCICEREREFSPVAGMTVVPSESRTLGLVASCALILLIRETEAQGALMCV